MSRAPRQLERFDNLVSLFLKRAEEKGDQPFLWAKRDGEWRSTSWAEAARQVASLAQSLARIGLQRGDRVALVSENRPEWLIADLGIMAAGCVTVPTYTTNTTRDHAHVLGNSGARAVIVSNQKLATNLVPAVLTSSECHHVIAMEPLRSIQAPDWVSCHSWTKLVSGEADVAALREASRQFGGKTSPASSTPAAPAALPAESGSTTARSSTISKAAPTSYRAISGGTTRCSCLSFPRATPTSIAAGQHFPVALGAQIYFAESLEKLAANIEEVQPTIMVVVPRLFELLRARIIKSIEAQGGLAKYLLGRALKIGNDKLSGRRKAWDLPMDGLLSLTLRKKVRAKVGGRQKAWVSGGAPLNPEVGISSNRSGSPSSRVTARPRPGRSSAATGRASESGSRPSAYRSRTPRSRSPRTARSWCAEKM